MDRLMKCLGADPVPWSYKTDCCGASLVMTRTDIVRKLNDRLLSMAMEAEADCLATGCPMCQANLDTASGRIGEGNGEEIRSSHSLLYRIDGISPGASRYQEMVSPAHHRPDQGIECQGINVNFRFQITDRRLKNQI